MHQTWSVWIWWALSNLPLNTERDRGNTAHSWIVGLWNHFITSRWTNMLLLLRCFSAWNGCAVTRERLDVAAGNSWSIGLKPATELCQKINNMDLVNDVCSCLESFFLFLRIWFFWEALKGELSCFHVKGMLLSVCFPGCLKLFTVPARAFSLCMCVCLYVCVWEKNTYNHGWCKKEVQIRHLSLNISLYQVLKYSVPTTGQRSEVPYLSLIMKSRHWFPAKCWHKISQTCTWPFWVSHSRAGARYKSWQRTWWKLFLLDISETSAHRFLEFQSRHQRENVTFFIYLGEYAN